MQRYHDDDQPESDLTTIGYWVHLYGGNHRTDSSEDQFYSDLNAGIQSMRIAIQS